MYNLWITLRPGMYNLWITLQAEVGVLTGTGGGAGVCGIVTVPYQIQKRVKTDLY
jgi:hypothetical protein